MTWKVCFRQLMDKLPGSGDLEFNEMVKRLVEIFEASAPNIPEGFEIDPLDDSIPIKKKYKPRLKSKAKSKQDKKLDATNGEGPSSVAKANRKVRDRMRRQEESTPEPAANSGIDDEAEAIDADEDVVASLQSLRTARVNRRKSHSHKFLSDEVVVEDPSDEEDATNEQTDQELIEVEDDDDEVAENSEAEIAVKVEGIDNEAHETESVDLDDSSAATSNRTGNLDRSDIDEDESALEDADETESVNLDEDHTITASGFDDPGGPEVDEDEATSISSNDDADSGENERFPRDTGREDGNKTLYHRLANRHVENYFDNAASDSESSDSSDSSASSIPAKARRNMSIEL
jgi:hypothetical protein